MGLSKNFEKEVLRRDKPECFGKFKETSEKDKKKCGMCWFNPYCRSGKPLPRKKEDSTKKPSLDKK
jgi:radical SAM protein with 4Fe4S-binding SPASM domain